MGFLRAAGLIGGVGWLASREIERKLRQRREDPQSFNDTPTAYLGGLAAGVAAYVLVGRRVDDG